MEDFEILFVDDEREILDIVEEYLSQEGYRVTVVDNGLKALGMVKERPFDLVFTDLKMPDFTGLELLAAIKEFRPETEVIIVTGFGSIESAIEAMKFGSYDYIQKPIKLDHLKMLTEKIVSERKLRDENILVKKGLKERNRYDELIGISPKMQEAYEIIDRIGQSSPSVLIQGERGTGKDLAARVIHKRSDRKDKPFVPVNCSGVVEGCPESELFDHVTDLFKSAAGGTIYLDEITEMPQSLQVKLLQGFQEEEHMAPMDKGGEDIGARIIAATSGDLGQVVKSGAIREDLFYRLDVFSLRLPPLRERREDICLLAHHFLAMLNEKAGSKVLAVSPEVMDIFLDYHWPGNVGELESMIKKAFWAGVDKVIEVSDLPSEISKFPGIIKGA